MTLVSVILNLLQELKPTFLQDRTYKPALAVDHNDRFGPELVEHLAQQF
jgi:hypothetical protein